MNLLRMKDWLEQTKDFVKKELLNAEAGHDWFHIERVYHNALTLLETETANTQVVLLAALLHDIADSKFHNGNETLGPKKARTFLHTLDLEPATIEHVVQIIENISYKGGHNTRTLHSIELDITQDADRLDALGAIGIARAFHYGGYKNRCIYDAQQPPNLNMSKEEYKNNKGTTINHFYEKLLLLKNKMNTTTGKKLAEGRHEFMIAFLSQFYAEIDAEQ